MPGSVEDSGSMFHRIVVPLDTSEDSLRALRPARAVADLTGAELVVVGVSREYRDVLQMRPILTRQIVEQGIAVNAVRIAVDRENVVDALLPIARKSDIVVAATQSRPLQKRLHRGVSEQLVHRSRCSILLIGPNVDPDRFVMPGRLLVCVNPDDPAAELVPAVQQWCSMLGMNLSILAVAGHGLAGHLANREPAGRLAVAKNVAVETDVVRQLSERIQRITVQTPESCVRIGDDPAPVIAAYAEEIGASAVVVAAQDSRGATGFLDGSVSAEVIKRSRCPVLVVHAD